MLADELTKTVDIKGVEVLRPGIWKGVPISVRDLHDMVEAFTETGDQLPVTVRLGHDARQAFAKAAFGAKAGAEAARDEEGWPSLGTPTALYVKGERLLADLTDVPVKLADWIKANRYQTRSGGLRFNRAVGGKVYRWMLDHIALLGGATPAVDGLADIGLSETDQDRAVEVVFSAGADDGWLALGGASDSGDSATQGVDLGDGKTALDQLITGMTALFDEHVPLVYKRNGAPMVRQLFAAFVSKLRESARADLPLSDGAKPMDFSLAAVRGLLKLSDDAETTTIVASLNDIEGVDALLELAEGMAFETADQLVGWLAGALGVGPGDLAGIASKVIEAMGGGIETPDPAAEPAAPAAPEENMSDTNTETPTVAPEMVQLSAEYTKLAGEVASLKTANALATARAKVETDARAKGLELPKPVFDTLVNLSAAGDTTSYAAILDNVRSVPTKEQGTAEAPESEITLSDTEKTMAARAGISEERVLAQKVADAAAAS